MGNTNLIQFPISSRTCPDCESQDVSVRWISKEFPYGADADFAMLNATVPVYTCHSCNLCYEDFESETRMHEVVCQHLGVLTPREIKLIRQTYGSRAEFSNVSGIGDASIARWESGSQIQSAAMDLLLRLLSRPTNRAAILSKAIEKRHPSSLMVASSRFSHLKVTPELENEAGQFVL